MSTETKVSLSEADRKQIATRNTYRHRLQDIHDTICDAEAHQLEPGVLEKEGILRQPLCLDEKSNFRPFFFDRFREELDDLSDPNYSTRTKYIPDMENHNNVRGVHHYTESYIRDHEPVGAPGCSNSS